MKRIIVLNIVNLLLFVALRYLSVLLFFLYGIGASASGEEYYFYILFIPLVVQLLIITFFFLMKKFIRTIREVLFLVAVIIVLYILGEMNLIPF